MSKLSYRRLAILMFGVPLVAAVSSRARKAHDDAFVFDAHVHVVNRQFYHGGDMGQRVKDGQFDLVRAKEGGVDAMFFSIFVTEDYYPQRLETKQTFRLMDLALSQLEKNRDKIELALKAADIERINKSGKIAAVLDLEGGFDLDGDLGILRGLYRLGLRSVQLSAHNWANNFADSCCSPAKYKGLNDRGRAVVREMNRLGMVINVSHASDATLGQTVDLSSDPVMATHHGMRALNDIPRNMPEDLMRKIAAKGGVIGFQIGNEFHNRKAFDWRTKHAGKPFWDTSEIAGRKGQLSIEEIDRKVAPQFPMIGLQMPDEVLFSPEDWIGVIEKAIAIVGEDHVALGSDFDGGPTLPKGMRDIADLPMLTEAMLRRGWPETRIRKFLGLNTLRVFRQVTD
ncbi:MAG TPA: membrane dipeptidase [Bryobacteraceae bacterium]|nr:membrane dipeptidase [Bryobacteraceae bacterium]